MDIEYQCPYIATVSIPNRVLGFLCDYKLRGIDFREEVSIPNRVLGFLCGIN